MSKDYVIKEVRFIHEGHLIHCYVFIIASSESQPHVRGWHHEVFNSSIPIEELYKTAEKSASVWPHKSPNNDTRT